MMINRLTVFAKNMKYVLAVALTLFSTLTPLVVYAEAKYDPSFYSSNDILFYNPNDTTCSSTGGTISSLSGSDNEMKIWNFLKAAGLSSEQAAGVMGNIQSESGGTFSPTIQEFGQTFGNGGYGLVQWTNYKNQPGGRRDNLVDALKKAHPDLMAKYYNTAYSSKGSYTDKSQGFVPKNATTGVLMPVEDNDALLLTQLTFLQQTSAVRSISKAGISYSVGVTPGTTEWEAVKKQTTITNASNVWVYSFEVPANIDTTAAARAVNGQKIFDLYSTAKSGSDCSSANSISGDKKALAQALISNPRLTYDDPADKKLLSDIASGNNNGNDFPCGININVLKMLTAITKDHTLRVNELNRACKNSTAGGLSSTASRHYAGNGSAVDFGPIDGIPSYSLKGANLILSYIGQYLVNNSGIGQSQGNCLPNLNIPAGLKINRFSDGCNHLHVDIPSNTDQNLKCKVPINFGGCDPSQKI